jgi:L-threonylcarbamoyladenylate synthase
MSIVHALIISRSILPFEDLCTMDAIIGNDVARAAGLLKAGELVAIPTETVYGLAANAYDADAVLKIFTAKERPAFDPLIVHIGEYDELVNVVADRPASAHALMEAFWPGPLTLVLPKNERIPDLVTSGLRTVAVRMPAHPVTLDLLRSLPFPLAAPSANPFGYVSPTSARHVADQLGHRIPYILDGGPCSVGVESTILGWDETTGRWSIFRHGGLPKEEIEQVVGELGTAPRTALPVAPGMLDSHYAPRKPLYTGDVPALMERFTDRRIGVISFSNDHPGADCKVLSAKGDLLEAARELFSALRELDAGDSEVILAEVFPGHGIGRAINDRLARASVART